MRKKKFTTVKVAAASVGLPAQVIRRAIATGQIRAIRPGPRVLYVNPVDVAAWMRNREVSPP